jgi:DNA-binding MarR family transcriptional regulator
MRSLHTHAKRYFLTQKVSFSESQVLFLLRSGNAAEMNKIKKELSVIGAFVTNLVDRLVKHKLVERQRGDKDRRKVTVALTDKGKYYLARLETHRKQFFSMLVEGLKKEDKRIIEKGMSILVNSLESMENFNV